MYHVHKEASFMCTRFSGNVSQEGGEGKREGREGEGG